MFCKQCSGEMEDTNGASYGTGEKIFRCKECGWTGVESVLLKTPRPKPAELKPEDILHNGIKYSDYKAVITIKDAADEQKVELTTYRADIIIAMMKAGLVLQAFEPGDTFSVEVAPHKLMMSTANFVMNQA
jgi:hypothetical protein